jgi:TonB family protein
MSETEATAAEIPRESVRIWPLYAAAALVLATLVGVWALLHPRPRADAGASEAVPAAVTLPSVELRADRSPTSGVLAKLSAGARVQARPDDGSWVEVETSDGRRGFLPADAVERDADRDARKRRAHTLLAFPPVFGVVGEDCDVRLAPYSLAARGGRLDKGAVIEIHSVDHSFFAFRDPSWGIAFVASGHVDLVPPDPKKPPIKPEKVRPLKDLNVVELEDEPAVEVPASPASPLTEPAPGHAEPPVLLTRVEPAYPEIARRAGIEGTVELEVSIDAAGRVSDVEVLRGLPLGLSQAAADAVRRWVYRPARTAGGPVSSRKMIRVEFQLRPAAR